MENESRAQYFYSKSEHLLVPATCMPNNGLLTCPNSSVKYIFCKNLSGRVVVDCQGRFPALLHLTNESKRLAWCNNFCTVVAVVFLMVLFPSCKSTACMGPVSRVTGTYIACIIVDYYPYSIG